MLLVCLLTIPIYSWYFGLSDIDPEPGDCGSWVINFKEDVLFGMLRGSSRHLGLAYITPGCQIIEDLEYMYPTYHIHLPQRSESRQLVMARSGRPANASGGLGFDITNQSAALASQGNKKKDYYKILEVEPGVDSSLIKKAYFRLAMARHPDDFPGDEHIADEFKDINEAYDILSNTV
jgi:hypothetical protein